LRRAPEKIVVDIETADEESLHYADLQFEERFEDMKAKNRKYHEEKINETTQNSQIALNAGSLTAAFNNDKVDYLSLQNLISSDKPATLSFPVSNHPLSPGYIPLSPGCIGHKRFKSYGGEDPTSPLQPERNSTILMPAKSYPNPSYMMFPTDLNKIESPWDRTFKDDLKRSSLK
jgi:hypothetical protein